MSVLLAPVFFIPGFANYFKLLLKQFRKGPNITVTDSSFRLMQHRHTCPYALPIGILDTGQFDLHAISRTQIFFGQNLSASPNRKPPPRCSSAFFVESKRHDPGHERFIKIPSPFCDRSVSLRARVSGCRNPDWP